MNIAGQLQGDGCIKNDGWMTIPSYVGANDFYNYGKVEITGIYLHFNYGGLVYNYCAFFSNASGTSFQNNTNIINNGLIYLPQGTWENKGGETFTNGSTGVVRTKDLTNEGIVRGSGKFYVTGTSQNINGSAIFGFDDLDNINFYDASNSSDPGHFDVWHYPAAKIGNLVIYDEFPAPEYSPDLSLYQCGDSILSISVDAGEIGYDQMICDGSTASTLVSVEDASMDGAAITYQWQSRTGSNYFTNITGATSSEYTPPTPTVTTDFLRKAYAKFSGIDTIKNSTRSSNIVRLTVSTEPVPQGSLTANGPFCGSGTGQLTWTAMASTGPFTVVYNDGVANHTQENVTSGLPFYLSPNVTSTTTYTLVSVTSAVGCTRSSGFTGGTATIIVRPNPTATIDGSVTICQNSSNPNITFTNSQTLPITVTYSINSSGSYTIDVDASSNNSISVPTGTPGTYTYSISSVAYQSNPGCSNNISGQSATVVINPLMSAGSASSTPSICINNPLTPITHSTIGATGIGSATGLPTGVSASFASNTITISGTPTASGTFNYTIPLTGGCGTVNATGTIIVAANNTVTAASSSPTLCISTPLSAITHTTTGAIGIGSATGLPTGVTASFASNTITISGTPTAIGTFNYSIPLTGGCGAVNATGTITVNPTIDVAVSSLITSNTCPDVIPAQGFNSDNTNFALGATSVTYRVLGPTTNSNWQFDYEVTITNSEINQSVASPNKNTSGTITHSDDGSPYYEDVVFWINNKNNVDNISVVFEVSNVKYVDNSCSETIFTNNSASSTIYEMPNVGPFNAE